MANVKKFVYVSTLAKWNENSQYILESTGKWFKSIVFRADTNEIYNRGKAYGLSVADAARITNLETAQAALTKAQLAVKSTDKVLTIEEGTGADAGKKFIYSTLSLGWDKTNKKLQLKGKGSEVVADLDATDFVKDGLLSDAVLVTNALEQDAVTEGDSQRPEVPYIKLTFNTDSGKDPVRFSVKSLVDVYTAANVNLTNAYAEAASWTPDTVIKEGASMETIVGQLVKGIKDAKANAGVTSVGGKTGAITLEGSLTANGTINLNIDEAGKITATINGLGSAAYTDATAYATAAQGATADSAIQTLTIAGKALSKTTNTLTAAEIKAALDLSEFAKIADVLYGVEHGTDGDYVSLSVGAKANNKQTLSVSATVQPLATADETHKGLVEASDVKKVIEDNEAVHAANYNSMNARLNTLEGTGAGSVAKALADAKEYCDDAMAWEEL